MLCLSYLLIGLYIFYYFSESDAMEGFSASSSSANNKAHKMDQTFANERNKLLSLVNDPERINNISELYDSDGNLIDSKKVVTDNNTYKFPESGHAHKLLDGMLGIEIGARSYQGFGLTTLNVDLLPSQHAAGGAEVIEEAKSEKADSPTTREGSHNEIDRQLELAGIVRRVDVTLSPKDVDRLPFDEGVLDFVLANRLLAPSSVENSDPFAWDPIISFCEWGRAVKDGGYLYAVLPNKERTFWHREKKSTTIQEVIAAHMKHVKSPLDHIDDPIIWNDNDATEFLWYMGLNVVDTLPQHDSVQGGYALVIQVQRKNGMISSRC
ncbi:unnamed protein product [Cylindrotheca closterium]|uniref:Methyltransferase type 11 domain-containing protein n=1 Tax=Cylindrotheca closterium TaxID=2856 RepID=A0AAD2FZ88_9STRA|nr:unnamed protein product [Cylindrotheca closterium]